MLALTPLMSYQAPVQGWIGNKLQSTTDTGDKQLASHKLVPLYLLELDDVGVQ